MKRISYLLLLILLSISVYSQNEGYTYKNEEFGVEVKFPSKPTESTNNNAYVTQRTANLTLISSGLSYQLLIQKASVKVDMVEVFKNAGEVIVTSKYKIDEREITEFELHSGGACTRYKIINYKKNIVWLSVTSQSCALDKDVFPFYNSIKINNILVQNPNTDNSKYLTYQIGIPSNTKSEITDSNKKTADSNSVPNNIAQQAVNTSDVDVNIPLVKVNNPHAYALIIGNEDYSSYQSDLSSEVNVAYALNDATMFKRYCVGAFGIQESNIKFVRNATLGQMNQAISWINKIIQKEGGDAEVVVYYAGHGLPDEQTHESYIMPVDVSGSDLHSAIKLQTLYSKLNEYPSKKITVFMDACFSGGGRGQGLVAARGVKVKAKADALSGNMVVFTSSSGDQSSLPFKDKQHGMFTYYLLKKLQETGGNVNYADLYNYVKKEVDLNCVKVNNKEQTPGLLAPVELGDKWKYWKLK